MTGSEVDEMVAAHCEKARCGMSERRTAAVKRDEDWRKTCDTWRLRCEKAEAETKALRNQVNDYAMRCQVAESNRDGCVKALTEDRDDAMLFYDWVKRFQIYTAEYLMRAAARIEGRRA